MAVFLVDSYCLGVKDCFGRLMVRAAYDAMCRDMDKKLTLENFSPADVRKLVEDAVQYARNLGLEPHPDYHRIKPIFGDIDPQESDKEFEFGSDGKPMFVSGPSDGPERCRQIISTLQHSCGPDGFHWTIRVGGADIAPFAIGDDDENEGDDGDDVEEPR